MTPNRVRDQKHIQFFSCGSFAIACVCRELCVGVEIICIDNLLEQALLDRLPGDFKVDVREFNAIEGESKATTCEFKANDSEFRVNLRESKAIDIEFKAETYEFKANDCEFKANVREFSAIEGESKARTCEFKTDEGSVVVFAARGGSKGG